jgi:hypothetical protein
VGGVYDFKMVVRRAGGAAVWEDGDNRALFVREGDGPLRAAIAWNTRP